MTGYLFTIKSDINSTHANIFLNKKPTHLVVEIPAQKINVDESTWITNSTWGQLLYDGDRLQRFVAQLADYALYRKYALRLFVKDFN